MTIIHCSPESYRAFRKLGRAYEARKMWQTELEMETLTPTPITHKIISIEIKIELYEVMIALALLRIACIDGGSTSLTNRTDSPSDRIFEEVAA